MRTWMVTTMMMTAFLAYPRLVPTFAAADDPGAGGAPAPRTACELLTLAEIGKIAGSSAIEIDPSQSGPDDTGGDNCVWKVKGNPNPFMVFQIKRVPADRKVEAAFSDERVSAFGGGPAPAAVSGLGDEALYRDFQRVKGGCLILRHGRNLVSFSGPVGRDAYVTLARLILQRL